MPRPVPWFEGVDPLLPSEIKPALYRFDEYQTYDLILFMASGRKPFPDLTQINRSPFLLVTGSCLVDRFVPYHAEWADQFAPRWVRFWERIANSGIRDQVVIPGVGATVLELNLLPGDCTVTWLVREAGAELNEFSRRRRFLRAGESASISFAQAALFSVVCSGPSANEVQFQIASQLTSWLLSLNWDNFLVATRDLFEEDPRTDPDVPDLLLSVQTFNDQIPLRKFFRRFILTDGPNINDVVGIQDMVEEDIRECWINLSSSLSESTIPAYPSYRPAYPNSPLENTVVLVAATNNYWGFGSPTSDIGEVCFYGDEGVSILPCVVEDDFYFKEGYSWFANIDSFSQALFSGERNLVKYTIESESYYQPQDTATEPPSPIGDLYFAFRSPPPPSPSEIDTAQFDSCTVSYSPLVGTELIPFQRDISTLSFLEYQNLGTASAIAVFGRPTGAVEYLGDSYKSLRQRLQGTRFTGYTLESDEEEEGDDPYLRKLSNEEAISLIDEQKYQLTEDGELALEMPDSVRVKEIHAALEADFFGSGANFKQVIRPDGSEQQIPNTVARQVEATQEAIQGFNFPGSFQSYRLRTTPDGVEQQDPANVNHLPALLYKIYEELALVLGPGAISDDAGDGFSRIEYQSIQDQIDDVLTNQSAQFGLTSSLSVETKRTLWILAQVLKAIGVPCEVQELELTGLGKVAVPRVSDSARSIRQSIDDIQLNLTPKI